MSSFEEDSSSLEEEEASSSEELDIEPRILPKRSTRGQRITSMHKEGDDDFWNQDFFQEEGEIEVYELSTEEEDEVDSDFDVTEDESDDTIVKVEKERTTTRNKYIDPALKRKKLQQNLNNKNSTTSSSIINKKRIKKNINIIPLIRRRSNRKSTRIMTEQSIKADEMDKKLAKNRIKKTKKVYKQMTLEENLKEAELTEIINKKSLAEFLLLKELEKKD